MKGIPEATRESQIRQGGDFPGDLAGESRSPDWECSTLHGHPDCDSKFCHGLQFDVLFRGSANKSQFFYPNSSSSTQHVKQLVTFCRRWLVTPLDTKH